MKSTTIWKFDILLNRVDLKLADTTIDVPSRAIPLSTGMCKNGNLCVWMLVEPDRPKSFRTIYVRGTGHDCSDVSDKIFVGTVQDTPYVWHVFIDR